MNLDFDCFLDFDWFCMCDVYVHYYLKIYRRIKKHSYCQGNIKSKAQVDQSSSLNYKL